MTVAVGTSANPTPTGRFAISEIVKQANPAPAFARLYALGADAFRLYPRLPMLRQFPNQRVYGLTGALSLTPDGRIVREQIWAKIDDGRPVPITTSDSETPLTDGSARIE